MERTVNVALVQKSIDEQGIAEISRKSGLSVYYLMKIKNRVKPLLPRKESSQLRLAEAMGQPRDDVFPLAATGEERAS